jgi:hypothetical protein
MAIKIQNSPNYTKMVMQYQMTKKYTNFFHPSPSKIYLNFTCFGMKLYHLETLVIKYKMKAAILRVVHPT